MPFIVSVAEAVPAHTLKQEEAMNFARALFSDSFHDIERLLRAFQNGQVEKRHFVKELEWYKGNRTFEDKNQAYIKYAVELGVEAIEKCLMDTDFINGNIEFEEIDAIFCISSSGLSTPSIEARIMNRLSFHSQTKRIPIWGLGCAGGASGLSRAYEYCLAFPKAKVLVLAIELCSLTFQREDRSKSNLIGTSLFADGVACALITGDQVDRGLFQKLDSVPAILRTESTFMKDSLDVMGWEIKNDGLFVVFSKDIPTIIKNWLKPVITNFLEKERMELHELQHFVAHPGGKKVIDAYIASIGFDPSMTRNSLEVLKEFGNMSSATILYVLRRFMEIGKKGEYGLATALGPGFCSEMLLLRWEN